MKFLRYLLAAMAVMAAAACGQEETPHKTTEDKGFDIEINDLHSSYCQVKVHRISKMCNQL